MTTNNKYGLESTDVNRRIGNPDGTHPPADHMSDKMLTDEQCDAIIVQWCGEPARNEVRRSIERTLVAAGHAAGATAERSRLLPVLVELQRAYVNVLQNGRDEIVFLGGECDSLDKMISDDPALAAARKAIEE